MRSNKAYLWFLILLVLGSCVSDKPEAVAPTLPSIVPGKSVFITNEGNYQWGNSSVSYYNIFDGKVTNDIFNLQNKRPLGDVCQSMTLFNQRAYLVINNSGKVEIVNPSDFKSIGVIKGLTSPRYFLGLSTEKAYVSDLYSNEISIVNLSSNTKVGGIKCSGWTEEMEYVNGKVFVTNLRKEYVYIVNVTNDVIEDSIKLNYAPSSIELDKNGKLWVLCNGDNSKNKLAGLFCINPVTEIIETQFIFSSSDNPSRLRINGSKDTLYYLNHGIFQMPIQVNALPTTSLVPENTSTFYGLGVDPRTNYIYVSDAVDYVQNGRILIYSPNGKFINSMNAGIIPGDFCYY